MHEMIDTLPFAESNTMHPQVQFQERGSLDAMQSEPKQHESAGTTCTWKQSIISLFLD